MTRLPGSPNFFRSTCHFSRQCIAGIAFPFFLCAWANSQAPSDSRVISGTVLDAQGRGVGSARLTLTENNSFVTATTTTNAAGRFTFSAVQPGEYRLTVTAPGFLDFARTVNPANDGTDLQIALMLSPVQSTVTVHDQQESLVVPSATAGSLTPISILDLPQSVQVVNRVLLDEQKTFQFADSLSYLAGVQRAYTTIAGAIGNEVAMRGFQLDYNNNYLRDGYKYPGYARSDTANIESVEVLKGPASALYGTAEAGGVVNLVTKKPTDSPLVSLGLTGGTERFLRPDFDLSGNINASKTLYYRLNGVYSNTNNFRDYIKSEQYFVAPYFLWKPNLSTSLAFQGDFSNEERVSDYGTVLFGARPAPVPVSTNYTEPWNNEVDRDRQGGYRFTHSFASGWTLTNGFQISRSNARYLEVYTTGTDTDPTQLTRLSDAFFFPALYRYSQTNLIGLVKPGRVTHHIAIGFEAGWVTTSAEGPAGFAPDVSVLHPLVGSDFTLSQSVAALSQPYFSLTYQTAIHTDAGYVQDQIDLGHHWKALAGFRVERYFQDSIDLSSNSHQKQTDVTISPRAGVVYQPLTWISLYPSYVRSFIPATPTALSAAGKQFSPEHDEQWEAGIKLASGSNLSATLAFFDIQKINVLAPDPNNQLFSVQNGQEKSKGAEFEFRGSLRPGWNLLTSYSFIQAQVTKSTQYPVGNILPNAPRNSGAVWTTYQFPGGPLRRLGLSAGAVATAARQDNFYNSALLPGYARLDVGAYYDFQPREKQNVSLP